jgi:hypothetical protein
MNKNRWRNTIAVLLIAAAMTLGTTVSIAKSEETVAFNTNSLKYHCLSCTWAKRCTVNCVNISISEAKKRGGIPCKVCGGSCR